MNAVAVYLRLTIKRVVNFPLEIIKPVLR